MGVRWILAETPNPQPLGSCREIRAFAHGCPPGAIRRTHYVSLHPSTSHKPCEMERTDMY